MNPQPTLKMARGQLSQVLATVEAGVYFPEVMAQLSAVHGSVERDQHVFRAAAHPAAAPNIEPDAALSAREPDPVSPGDGSLGAPRGTAAGS